MVVDNPLFIAPFDKIPSLGRFVLRDAGATIAIGTILELKKMSKKYLVYYKHSISHSIHAIFDSIPTHLHLCRL